jgi:UTP--glucose-1-phosphate uridylyltransferase
VSCTTVRKAIIPAAGLGTRVRGITGDLPKELLTVAAKPLIVHAIEGLAASGVREIAVVISSTKESIRKFLQGNPPDFLAPQLDAHLKALFKACAFSFFVQPQPSGLADAVSLCRKFVGSEPFALIMPDNILLHGLPVMTQIMPFFSKEGGDILGAITLEMGEAFRFGNVGILKTETIPGRSIRFRKVSGFSDKTDEPLTIPPGEKVLKNFGGSIFLPHFFDYIEECRSHAQGELDDVPVIQAILRDKGLHVVVLEGDGFDVGNPAGYRAASLHASRSSR